jgi:hypothetical protein
MIPAVGRTNNKFEKMQGEFIVKQLSRCKGLFLSLKTDPYRVTMGSFMRLGTLQNDRAPQLILGAAAHELLHQGKGGMQDFKEADNWLP